MTDEELIAALRETMLLSKAPDYTLYVNGQESRCQGAETRMIYNRDGEAAARRIEELLSEVENLQERLLLA